jgi:hypothetical protein
MKTEIATSDPGMLALTRGMLGVGLGLLAANRLDAGARKPVGLTLVAVGLLTTIPLALAVIGGAHRERRRRAD